MPLFFQTLSYLSTSTSSNFLSFPPVGSLAASVLGVVKGIGLGTKLKRPRFTFFRSLTHSFWAIRGFLLFGAVPDFGPRRKELLARAEEKKESNLGKVEGVKEKEKRTKRFKELEKWANSSRTTGRGSSSSARQLVSWDRSRRGDQRTEMLTRTTRPNHGCFGGLLLAEDILRLPNEDVGPRGEAVPDIADHQSGNGHTSVRLGVPAGIHSWILHPPKPRGSSGSAAIGRSRLHPHLPRDQRRCVLRGRHDRLLLGIQ